MTGRGIDQVMREPVPPVLYESFVRDAREYVRLAERVNGPIGAPVSDAYPWGDALEVMDALAPHLRIVNLETAITRSPSAWPGKEVHYRMSPAHTSCLKAARIDACCLANNHILDWGTPGLADTLQALDDAGLRHAGAGRDGQAARAPAALPLPAAGRRLLMFAWAAPDCGVPTAWAATDRRAGIAWLPGLDEAAASEVASVVRRHRGPGDLVLVSLHWGANWVQEVPSRHRRFARRLIELDVADVVHGHSSHHPLPFEVHAGKLILYGCGDLINDYEGIGLHGDLRSDVGCWYAASLDARSGSLRALEIVPMQVRQFRLRHPSPAAFQWLTDLLIPRCRAMGTRLEAATQGRPRLVWSAGA